MVLFQAVMLPLSKALGLSVAVERGLEFAKNLTEPLVGGAGARARPDPAIVRRAVTAFEAHSRQENAGREAEATAQRRATERASQSTRLQAAREQLLTEPDPGKRAALLTEASRLKAALSVEEGPGEMDESHPATVLVVQGATDPDQGWTLRAFVLQLLGFAAGIIMASFADLRLFSSFGVAIPGDGWVDHVLTGMFIGGGSGPVHTLIEFITARKTVETAPAHTVAEAPATKAPAPTPEPPGDDWVDVPYAGGVDVQLLEGIHRRPADPSLIVYHHTAMSSSSTFEDVVRVIQSRTGPGGVPWVTGYHCVILADGSIHAFCRWDRYGNHAVGYNLQSLGISFNGNFETNPYVPFSNADGRFGAPRPTEPQLHAGARVVALWTFLYKVPIDFDRGIIPHRQISSKACPGSSFPYDEFRELVTHYRQKWDASAVVKERIAAFKLKPYLYV